MQEDEGAARQALREGGRAYAPEARTRARQDALGAQFVQLSSATVLVAA